MLQLVITEEDFKELIITETSDKVGKEKETDEENI